VFVAASSECLPDLSYRDMIQRLVDLEYTAVELAIHEQGGHLKPSRVMSDPDASIETCRATQRLTLAAFSFETDADEEQGYRQFTAVCKLAKAMKVVPVIVRAGEQGTPFNAEVERLQQLVAIASLEGVRVGVKNETGRVTEDADTIKVLCDNVKGLGLALDPSHFVYKHEKSANYEHILPYVIHVHLRDTSKEKLQVRVGQGEVEYGRLINQLSKHRYNRALSVHITPMEGIDHSGELRKMRLLLESLL